MPPPEGGGSVRPLVPLLLVAGFAVAALVLGAGAGGSGRQPGAAVASWRGLVGGPRPPAAIGQRMIVVLRAPSLAERVARAGGPVSGRRERQWTAAARTAQRELIAGLRSQGLRVTIEHSYVRVLNGFSAALDGRAAVLLERSSDVVGVYPVRAAYPAAVASPAAGSAGDPGVSLPGFDGRGVTIALLDTGGAERHGRQLAGILARVAPGATVLPIPVAGPQPDVRGRRAVFARSDQLIAGLERAVDPNGDGDAHDAARIALVALSEPYAAFADSPEALAVGGALDLDTLVVAAAGNDGPAGPAFGSISGPGGAPGALTVGAADLRSRTAEARLVLRTGLRTGFNRLVPLAGSAAPTGRIEGELAAPGAGGTLAGLFDRRGLSLVAGRIALLPVGAEPAATAERAAQAGAEAVILYGRAVPAGSIGADVPVVAISAAVARPVLAALRSGASAVASIGDAQAVPNAAAGRVASFSSRGLAFNGRLKPDLVASGVSLRSGLGAVSGTSAAAAVTAGAAAVLAQARPEPGAAGLRGLLIGTARPLAGERAAAQGAGLVDLGGSAAGELAVDPPVLALGRGTAGRMFRRTLVLRSLSSRPLEIAVGSRLDGPVTVTTPRRVALPPHGTAHLAVTVRVDRVPAARAPAIGMLVLDVAGGDTVRTPLTLTFGPRAPALVRSATLSRRAFAPSDSLPALLSVSAGRVTGRGVEPVQRLDLQLATAAGVQLGLLARLRDLLPGRYVFGLTGRDPSGAVLAPGGYRLTLVATPTDGGPPSRKQVDFQIK